jgi:hypothetical integral membrane protein (TIGR02206 family)
LNKINNINSFLLIIGIICIILEVAKVVWGISVHRYSMAVQYIPLWFCSLFVPTSVLASITKGKVRHMALSFMFYGGIVGGIAYLLFPTTSLYKFPLFHFISFHSMIYHSLMIYTGLVIAIKHIIAPNIKDFIPYMIFTTIVCIIAYVVNVNYGTNFMFLNSTSNNPILYKVMQLTNKLYPIVITLAQNIGTFFITYFGYYVITKLNSLLKNKKYCLNKR